MESVNSQLISSRQNPKIKQVVALQNSHERQQSGLFTLEGYKEIEKAILKHYHAEAIYFCPAILDNNLFTKLLHQYSDANFYEVTQEVFAKIAYRENSVGIVMVAKQKKHQLDQLKKGKNPLFLVIEGIEKPGNLGAIYRTADAAGVDAIILCNAKSDLYNPNAIRASLGCIFTVPTAICTSHEAIKWLVSNEIQIFATYLQAAIPYHTANFALPSAIVVGTEATGISQDWVEASTANLIIPMKGIADSLNVSTSTAIVLFEACRQRGF
jgi:TrmH family RNA methyltransferase